MSKSNVGVIKVDWEGPFTLSRVISQKNDAGEDPTWGVDYGVYQIYAEHILCGKDTLVYVGETVQQTFSQRFKQHKKYWLEQEKGVQIYLGKIGNPQEYSTDDLCEIWIRKVKIAEKIIIYKYTPNYNSSEKGDYPKLSPFEKVKLIHKGNRHQLHAIDVAPNDYKYD